MFSPLRIVASSSLATTLSTTVLQTRRCSSSQAALAVPQSGRLTIFKLTCFVRGACVSSVERERARSHQIGATKQTQIELVAPPGPSLPNVQ